MPQNLMSLVCALLLAVALATPTSAVTYTWVGGDGSWSTAAEWSPATGWVDGNTAYFDGASVPNRSRLNRVNVDGTYSPTLITGGGGYGGRFVFYGSGDLTGAAKVVITGANWQYWERDFSLTGSIDVISRNNQYNAFGFVPTVAGTQLNQTINLGDSNAAGYYAALEGNTNADWTPATINVGGNVIIGAGSSRYGYSGATFQLQKEVTFLMASHYDGVSDARFNGDVTGSGYDLTLLGGVGYNTHNNYLCYLTGPLAWDVRNVNKNDDVKLIVVPANYTTAFAGMRDNGGAFNINSGEVVFRNTTDTANLTTLELTFPLRKNTTTRGLGSVTTINVGSGGSFGGTGSYTGTVNVNAGGALAPGASPGILTITGNTAMASGSALQIELNGRNPGTGYDQLVVNGTVTLNGPTLSAQLGFDPFPGSPDRFFIVANDAGDAITGTFAGLADGATVSLGAWGPYWESYATIGYFGDSLSGATTGGNDVVLYNLVLIPEPAAAGLLLLGLAALARRRR